MVGEINNKTEKLYQEYLKVKLDLVFDVESETLDVSALNYDKVRPFKNGYSVVEKNEKYIFIDAKGQLVSSDTWYDYIGDFSE